VGKLQTPPGIGRAQFANRARAFNWYPRKNNIFPLRHRCSFFKAEPFEKADPALMHVFGRAIKRALRMCFKEYGAVIIKDFVA
jgi:hypothetical protein